MTWAEVRTGPARARVVADGSYAEALGELTASARDRLWCSMFIVDTDPSRDGALLVADSLRSLAAASWRGVDVRLLLGGSRTSRPIAEAVAAGACVARNLGLSVRDLGHDQLRGSHVKLVVADNLVLVGSHNWSAGAFTDQIQDSVLVESADLSAYLANTFLDQWRRAATGAQQ